MRIVYLLVFILCASNLFGQIGYREKDVNAYKFIGSWTCKSEGEEFSITFWKEEMSIGLKSDKTPLTMEVLKGLWKIKNNLGESVKDHSYAVIANTMEYPNTLEGSINDNDHGKTYNFSLTMLEKNSERKAQWIIVKEKNSGNSPKRNSILYSLPKECIMQKVE